MYECLVEKLMMYAFIHYASCVFTRDVVQLYGKTQIKYKRVWLVMVEQSNWVNVGSTYILWVYLHVLLTVVKANWDTGVFLGRQTSLLFNFWRTVGAMAKWLAFCATYRGFNYRTE